jgi:N-acetylmuramoyl-L-alanine amidase
VARAVVLAVTVALLAPPSLAAARSPSRPDRSLYLTAKKARDRLTASARLQARRDEWEAVVIKFRKIVAQYPRSAYCDDALLAVGDLYRQMAEHFKATRYYGDANEAYDWLVREYPSSSLGEKALFSSFEIARVRNSRTEWVTAGRRYLANYPSTKNARIVRTALRERGRASTEGLPKESDGALARLFNLRSWSGDSSTRVVLDLEKRVKFRKGRLQHPDRLFLDLAGTRLHSNLETRKFPVEDGLLQQVRIAQFDEQTVRVVLDFKDIADDTIFFLDDPVRLVIDVRAQNAPEKRIADETTEPRFQSPRDEHPSVDQSADDRPDVSQASTATSPAAPDVAEARVAAQDDATENPEPPTPQADNEGHDSLGARLAEAPLPPRPNRSGDYSLPRQLGLGARRIVIDPGHGGHDPGTIGPSGIQEKDLVLDVALRLEKLIRRELGMDVIMTRRTDVFVPLEERTAIANTRKADLFLSIHVNSSRSGNAAGVETYYLNWAVDSHAEEVAARENAISPATLKDLGELIKRIQTNSKIEESRDFAASVQASMVSYLKPHNPVLSDRGVRRAPFYVLLGAQMPSILAEIAFVSHAREARLLSSPDYRQDIAEALLRGVRSYMESLNATKTRRTARSAARAPARRASR